LISRDHLTGLTGQKVASRVQRDQRAIRMEPKRED
jgi:hypothetical protein